MGPEAAPADCRHDQLDETAALQLEQI